MSVESHTPGRCAFTSLPAALQIGLKGSGPLLIALSTSIQRDWGEGSLKGTMTLKAPSLRRLQRDPGKNHTMPTATWQAAQFLWMPGLSEVNSFPTPFGASPGHCPSLESPQPSRVCRVSSKAQNKNPRQLLPRVLPLASVTEAHRGPSYICTHQPYWTRHRVPHFLWPWI